MELRFVEEPLRFLKPKTKARTIEVIISDNNKIMVETEISITKNLKETLIFRPVLYLSEAFPSNQVHNP